MKPAPFDYIRAESRAEAVAHLADYGDGARLLAGGQSLLAMLNMRLVLPELLIDISRTADLTHIRRAGNMIEIGAAVTQSQLERWPELERTLPLVAKAMPHLGHFQTRNKGTVCGSIAHADPASELPLCLTVLNGEVVLEGRRSSRVVGGRDFFTGLLQTARRADEMIAAVCLPAARVGEAYAFRELAVRHGDFAIIAVAVRLTATALTIGIGGSAERPEVRDWPMLDGSALDDALTMLAAELPLQDDVQADAHYRRILIRSLGRAAIEEARSCLS
ncbi:MAG TPA: FAD binding domain-containing protein [Hyphomicrobiales bacterium]|jgi:2-furoyl-CoA dehydrogenase FAD binding subunit